MKTTTLITLLLLATGSATRASEETQQPTECTPATRTTSRSFDGMWKLDEQKSQLTGETYTIDQTAPETFRFDMHDD